MALPNAFLNTAPNAKKKKEELRAFQQPFQTSSSKRPADLQPPTTLQAAPPLAAPSVTPRLDGMLSPLVQPSSPIEGGMPSIPQLGNLGNLPPKQQIGGLTPSNTKEMALPSLPGGISNIPPKLGGLGNVPLPIKPPSQSVEKPKPLYTTDQLKAAFRPDVKFKDMLAPSTITTGSAPTTETAPTTPAEISTGTGENISSGASRFVNFDRILAANQPAASAMAQKAIGETVARGEKAAKGIQSAGQEFIEGTQTGIPETGNRITSTGNLEYDIYTGRFAPSGPQVIGQAGGFGYAKTPDISLAEAERRAAQGYVGPTSEDFFKSESYKQAQTDLQKARETLKGMQNQEGLEAYMNQLYGTTGGTGGSRLDAALARAAGGQAFKAPQERFKNIDQLMSETTQAAQTAEERARTQAEASQKYWQQQVADTKASMESWQKAEEDKKKEEHNWKMQNDPAYREAYLKAVTGYSNPYTEGSSGNVLYDNPYV